MERITDGKRGKLCILTEPAFKAHVDEHDGFCRACGQWSGGGVEPDAVGYECEACSAPRVCGAEECLMRGFILFEEW